MNKKTTADILAESFQEIAEQKNVNRITINDIVKNCGFSPATFYRHFRDKYDLIAWVYGKKASKRLAALTQVLMDGSAIVRKAGKFCST